MRGWYDIAILAKTRNLNGGFVAKSAAGLPFLLEEGTSVAFVPPQLDVPREARVVSVEMLDDTSAVVHFDAIDSKSVADELVGCHCLVQLSEEDLQMIYEQPQSWEGWDVIDEQFGMIGSVVRLVENPSQALLEVERADGDAQATSTVLIPVVDEFIVDVDVDARVICTQIPRGLLELSQ